MDLKYLITGGLGFIGSNFIFNLLKKKKIKIYNLDSEEYSSNLQILKNLKNFQNFSHTKVDLSNFSNLKKIFDNIKPDILINFAAETHVDNSIRSSKKFINSNILGTYNLLECTRSYLNNNNLKNFKFIQISTDEVYGDIKLNEKKKFFENSNLKPSSPYSATKASADMLVSAWHRTYNLPIIITRSSNNYGPYQNKEKLIPKIIFNIISRRKIPIYGKGKNVRNWIYVKDNVNAIMKVISKGKIGEIYNIGSKNEISNINIAKLICLELSKKLKKYSYSENLGLITYVEDRKGHDEKYSLNTKKIKKLKWKEKTNLLNGIKKTIDWYLNK